MFLGIYFSALPVKMVILSSKSEEDLCLAIDEISDLEECKRLLKRAHAVTVMAEHLTLASSDEDCFKEVTNLMIKLFGIERCSIGLIQSYTHVRIVECAYTQDKFQVSNYDKMPVPLLGTSIGELVKTLSTYYSPRAEDSSFRDIQQFAELGLKSIVRAPLLVPGGKMVGMISVAASKEDAFSSNDRTLIRDAATCLAINLYARREQRTVARDHEAAHKLLGAMIPPTVLSRIEHFWRGGDGDDDATSDSNTQESVSISIFINSWT